MQKENDYGAKLMRKTIYEAVFKGSIRNIGILREWDVIHRKSVQKV